MSQPNELKGAKHSVSVLNTLGNERVRSYTAMTRRFRAQDRGGNTLALATELSPILGTRTIQDNTGRGDRDLYKIVFDAPSRVRMTFQNLSDAPMAGTILNAQGQIVFNAGQRLTGKAKPEKTKSLLFDNIPPGTYYFRMSSPNRGTHRYRLNLVITQPASNPGLPCGCES